MQATDLLVEGYERIREAVHDAVEGLSPDLLNARPAEDANSISWLVWHLARVQDDHRADAAGADQVWLAEGWQERFALDLPARDTGFGHSPEQVGRVRVASGDLLTGYYDAVHERTRRYLHTLTPEDLTRVVDESWDPPTTLGVRLVSVLADDLQHAGQAAYARGLLTAP